MQRLKKHISFLLLAVFSVTLVPGPVLHELFADHIDAADNHCRYFHKDLGRHVEEQQTHCDIFKTHTPLYDAVKISPAFTLYGTVITSYKNARPVVLSLAVYPKLPARAPPIA